MLSVHIVVFNPMSRNRSGRAVFCVRVSTPLVSMMTMMEYLRGLAALLLLSAGGEHGDQLRGVDEALVVDIHLVVRLVDLVGGELVAPGHERVPEPLGVDLALVVEGLEGVDDDVVLVGAAGHAVREEGEELSEVDGAGCLINHLVELLLRRQPAERVEGGAQIVLADDAVLVVVH